MKSISTSIAAMALIATPAPASAETLADAIALAYRTNPTLGSSRYDVRQADEGVAQARAELRPTLDFQEVVGFDHRAEGRLARRINRFSPGVTNQNSSTAQLSLAQPLYTGGRATADRRIAEAQVGAARQSLRGVEGDLLLSVITAYVDVRQQAAALDVWRGSVGELDKIVREIEARRESGDLTLTDVAQARAQLDEARQQAISSEEQLEAARADYAVLTGREPGTLAPEPPLPALPRDIDTAYGQAEQNSPDLSRALFTERASREGIAAARSSGAPTLSLRGTGTLSGTVHPYRLADQDRDLAASLVVSIPLSAGGRIASQIRQAQDRNGQDRFRIEATRRDLMRDVRNAWNAAATAGRATTVIEARRQSAAIQLDGMLQEYRVGLRSTFDVLYAQQSVRDAQITLLGAMRDRYVAQATLLRRTGSLAVGTIMAGVPLHDPAPHLRQAEQRNHVPWEGALATVDAIRPAPPIAAIEQLAPARQPTLVPAAPASADPPLARSAPTTPILGTTGRPADRSQP